MKLSEMTLEQTKIAMIRLAVPFGNICDDEDMVKLLENLPKDCIVMGNISPSGVFNCDSTRKVRLDTQRLLLQCMNYDNFIISSGCDIPADTDLDNIDKFFETVELGYYKRMLWDTVS